MRLLTSPVSMGPKAGQQHETARLGATFRDLPVWQELAG